MVRAKIDRTGEETYNNFGSKMIITKYNNRFDIDIYFPEYDYTVNHAEYSAFKKGQIKCPYERRTYGIGYLGDGEYSSRENGKTTKCYKVWQSMLERCYDSKYQEKYPTYIGRTVCDEWLDFQNFAEWFEDNYYQIENEVMCLDKDILVKGNKIYSPETCCFVPEKINTLFTKRDNDRGKCPIGTYQLPSGNYGVYCNNGYGKSDYLGTYSNKEEAFRVYKQYKEKVIKQVADKYKEFIPQELYEAMYNYEVEIDD